MDMDKKPSNYKKKKKKPEKPLVASFVTPAYAHYSAIRNNIIKTIIILLYNIVHDRDKKKSI